MSLPRQQWLRRAAAGALLQACTKIYTLPGAARAVGQTGTWQSRPLVSSIDEPEDMVYD